MSAQIKTSDTPRARFDNLVELIGTVTRCPACRKKGFLAEVGVKQEDNHRARRTYFATWEHPDDGSTALCEWEWP